MQDVIGQMRIASDVRCNYILVVCEEVALLVEAAGKMTVFRKSKEVDNEPTPTVAPAEPLERLGGHLSRKQEAPVGTI